MYKRKGKPLNLKVHNVFLKVALPPWLHPVKIWLHTVSADNGEHRKFQTVYAGPTNLCQHSTTDFARGIMTNEPKQSALLKAQSFKHSKIIQAAFCIHFITNEQLKLVSFT